jgi:predicted phosphodiesterase
MRLAVLSDVHGNMTALEAVLADLASVGAVDKIWVLGDLAFFGPEPAACVERLRQLQAEHPKDVVQIIGGNTDRYLVTGKAAEQPPAKDAEALQQRIAQQREGFTLRLWTLEQFSWETYDFLAKTVGQELALTVPEYGTVIGFHAVPGDDEPIALRPDSPDEEAADALLDREGRLALAGHTHARMDRTVGRWRVINPGSVGLSFTQVGMAEWALLTFNAGQVEVDLRAVPFDPDAVVARAVAAGYPLPEVLASRLRFAAHRS